MSDTKKGRGRPTKNKPDNSDVSNNSSNLQTNERIESNNNLDNDIPDSNTNLGNDIPKDDSDLSSFMKDKKSSNDNTISFNNSNSFDDDLANQIENFESEQHINEDIPSKDWTPLDEAAKKRGYTDGSMGLGHDENVIYSQEQGQQKVNAQERVISEPNYTGSGHSNKPDIDATLINPSNNDVNSVLDAGDNQFNGGSGNGGNSNNNSNTSTSTNNGNSSTKKVEKNEDSNLKELSPKEKRQAVEKTAEAILLAYRNYMPLPFVYIASYDIKKLKKLEEDDLIDLQTPAKRDGTTFLEYTKEFNEKVEEAFKVTDAEVEALREPLIDVLSEQEIAFTPTQNLLFTFGQIVVAKTMSCIQLYREKKSDIEEMKEMHRERMELLSQQGRQQQEEYNRQREEYERQQAQAATYNQNQQQAQNDNVSNLKVVREEPIIENNINNNPSNTSNNTSNTNNSNVIVKEEKVEEIKEEKIPTLDDALNMDNNNIEENTNNTENNPKNNNDNDIPD
jgi:hypothetical protein